MNEANHIVSNKILTSCIDEKKTNHYDLSFNIISQHPNLQKVIITVPARLIDILFENASIAQQKEVHTSGFTKKNVPLSYVKENYRLNIIEHVKEFLLKFVLLNYLYEQIYIRKITVGGEPRLTDIHLEVGSDATFHFDLTIVNAITFHEWKYFPFKMPKRKNYKDLDKQVDNFIQEETTFRAGNSNSTVALYDWVNVVIHPVDAHKKSLLNECGEHFWFRMGDDEFESVLRELFFGKALHDVFITHNQGLQDHFSDVLNANYSFKIEIKDIVPHHFFCFDQFRTYFRIKTNKDMHKKLIEVFSYRNDISQRRAIVEESLALLLAKHKFEVPKHLVLRQQNNILTSIRANPDYNVYRKQNDFNLRIEQLAYRQAKEMALVDQVAYHENIDVSHEDLKGYLNLTKRNRMKEFLYFDIPYSKRNGQEIPMPAQLLKQTCLREKTVNYIIYHLTKK